MQAYAKLRCIREPSGRALLLLYRRRRGSGRAKFGVKAPAISGHPDFERYFRVQGNTLEWMPIFLPSLWLFALYVSDSGAAVIGLVWILGRILYFVGYTQAAEKRGRGFALQALAATTLMLGALIGVAARILASA